MDDCMRCEFLKGCRAGARRSCVDNDETIICPRYAPAINVAEALREAPEGFKIIIDGPEAGRVYLIYNDHEKQETTIYTEGAQ